MDIEALNQKINEHFAGKVVRKDLTKTIKGNSVVPTYVLEYLLGQYCATDDEESIKSGIEKVKKILQEHFVHRKESKLVQSNIREKGHHRVIDKVTVELNPNRDFYEATFMNLGLKKINIESDFAKKHPKLLVGGIWCIVELKYKTTEEKGLQPWILETLKPIQVSNFDDLQYIQAREEFETEEWINLIIQSIGLNPEMLSQREKLLQLIRLIPFCERNYNLIELGPKGTGKSHVFSEFSPHGILVSGGEITAAKLFVNNQSAKVGLVGFWDSVAFDEFAGKEKRVDKNLIDIMKNYMANKSFSRGTDSVGAEASMSFLGNTKRNVEYMMRHTHFFEELPDKYIDSAFLDRLHCYLPGWETQPIRSELFSDGFGFIVDYLAEGLKYFRNLDFSHHYTPLFELNSDITTRDRDGILKTFSGLMKIIYPHEKFKKTDAEDVLKFSIEMRKRVKDQLLKIDETFTPVSFSYVDQAEGREVEVFTLEELQYPKLAASSKPELEEDDKETTRESEEEVTESTLESGEHRIIQDNMKGISYEVLFARHLKDSKSLTIEDPYIREIHQIRNLFEFLKMFYKMTPEGEENKVHLVTVKNDDPYKSKYQEEDLNEIVNNFETSRVKFSYTFSETPVHARSIQTDTGWKISLDRGLDIFQRQNESGIYNLVKNIQEERLCKKFEITYLNI